MAEPRLPSWGGAGRGDDPPGVGSWEGAAEAGSPYDARRPGNQGARVMDRLMAGPGQGVRGACRSLWNENCALGYPPGMGGTISALLTKLLAGRRTLVPNFPALVL